MKVPTKPDPRAATPPVAREEVDVRSLQHELRRSTADDLPALYSAADLYVGASRRHDLLAEGFGISLVEASACGLAVVGGRSGGVPDAVREGETGILVDPDDPNAVAAGINELLANPERRKELGAAGRKAVETYYNWDRVVKDLIHIDERYRR